jgi:hypothetical protein
VGEIVEVRDVDDPRLADFRDLTLADRRPDRPGGRGLVIAEGVTVVRRLLDSPYPPQAVFGVPAKISQLAADVHSAGARASGSVRALAAADLAVRIPMAPGSTRSTSPQPPRSPSPAPAAFSVAALKSRRV